MVLKTKLIHIFGLDIEPCTPLATVGLRVKGRLAVVDGGTTTASCALDDIVVELAMEALGLIISTYLLVATFLTSGYKLFFCCTNDP